MTGILLSKSDTPIIGWIADLLGLIMEGIFNVLDFIRIPNVGLSVILFTIVVYLLMLPLTIKQQKFSKLSAKMNPELQSIQAKYKNRKDQDSMMQMNAETKAVYAKYGVSPTGSCVQLLIQMPILLSLYQVIYRMPAYVSKIGNAFGVLADEIMNKGLVDKVKGLAEAAQFTKNFTINEKNAIIDVLNKMNSSDLLTFAQENGFSDLQHNGHYILSQGSERGLLDIYNNFLGLNMANSPSSVVHTALETGAWLMVIAAISIPVLSAVTQWINVKLMPQPEKSKDGNQTADSMASSMKTMNLVMPVFSAFFCYTLPAGMGLYWIAGSVVRSIQQILINKHIDKMDLNEIIEKNKEKSAKKMEKVQKNQARLQQYANMKTKGINGTVNTKSYEERAKVNTGETKSEGQATNNTGKASSAKPGSLLSKANMVKDYNERNNK